MSVVADIDLSVLAAAHVGRNEFLTESKDGVRIAKFVNDLVADGSFDAVSITCSGEQRIASGFFEGLFSELKYKKDNIKDYIRSVSTVDIGFNNEKGLLTALKRNFYRNIEGC